MGAVPASDVVLMEISTWAPLTRRSISRRSRKPSLLSNRSQTAWSAAVKGGSTAGLTTCCNNYSIACRRSSQNEYNCNSGKRSNWTSGKARFCCRTQGKGCRRTNSGRRLEESDSSENADYYDDESSESADYYGNEFDLESEPDQESPDYYDDELDLESEPEQASMQ